MRSTKLKLAAYIGLTALGHLVLLGAFIGVGEPGGTRISSDLVVAGGLVALGALGLKSVQINYQGGAPTVIGAFLMYLSAVSVAVDIEQSMFESLGARDVAVGVAGTVALALMGGVLLYSGHRTHNLKKSLNEDAA